MDLTLIATQQSDKNYIVTLLEAALGSLKFPRNQTAEYFTFVLFTNIVCRRSSTFTKLYIGGVARKSIVEICSVYVQS